MVESELQDNGDDYRGVGMDKNLYKSDDIDSGCMNGMTQEMSAAKGDEKNGRNTAWDDGDDEKVAILLWTQKRCRMVYMATYTQMHYGRRK